MKISFMLYFILDFFHTYYGALSSDDCRKAHYKFSPQLKKIICLCQYNERPCDTFANCVSGSKVCSDRGFCITSKPFSKCECLNGHTGYHCEKTIKPCDLLPKCKNNGTCINNKNFTWSCKCSKGFFGKQCEYLDYCFGVLCYNKGKCINDNNGNFKCICGNGFQGRNCEIELSKCPKCRNNGKCISPDLGFTFLCQCSNGSFGSLCEFQLNPCNSGKKCLNFGSCYADKYGREFCYCQRKYYGTSCERYSACLVGLFGNNCELSHICYRNPRICFNSGRCEILNIYTYICQCKPGFHGKHCKRRQCTKDSDCLHGGSCDRDSSTSRCICAAHFMGKFCQYINRCYGNYICNIKGQCILKAKGEFKECICNEGYYGQYCNKNAKLDRSEL